MFIATDEKVRMSRLATIFPVVAEYFLKRSVTIGVNFPSMTTDGTDRIARYLLN
jgi:hypothetical protein